MRWPAKERVQVTGAAIVGLAVWDGAALARLPLAAKICLSLAAAGVTFLVLRHLREHEPVPENDRHGQPTPLAQALATLDGADTLTDREREVLEHALAGDTQAQTASAMELKPATVGTYRQRAYRKLGISSKQELIELVSRGIEGEGAPRQSASVTLDDIFEGNPCETVIGVRLSSLARAAFSTALVMPVLFGLVLRNAWVWGLLCLIVGVALLAPCVRPPRHTPGEGNAAMRSLGLSTAALGISVRLVSSTYALAGIPAVAGASVVVVLTVIASRLAYRALTIAPTEVLRNITAWAQAGTIPLGIALLTPSLPLPAQGILAVAAAALCVAAHREARRAETLRRERQTDEVVTDKLDRVRAYLYGRGLGSLQIEVALLTALGYSVAGISERAHVSRLTVPSYRSLAYETLRVNGRDELLALLRRDCAFPL